MKINEIKNPEDVLAFMKANITYGWVDIEGNKHIKEMKGFRKIFRISSLEETLETGLGTCIEQVALMKYLIDRLNIPTKMFCCRIYEPDDYNNLEEEEHMHCFLLYYSNGKVYQIEHPNYERIGIYEYNSEEEAIDKIVAYYVKRSGGVPRPTDEFFEVPVGLTFKQFNAYINNIKRKTC
jgi:hypothetical protein